MVIEKETNEISVTLKIIDALGQQAEVTKDPELKKILLVSSCEIIDRLLKLHDLPQAA